MRSSKSRSRNKSNRQRTLGNVINRVFDSSGPEGKVRGTPQQIIEKYLTLARDAQLSGDRVAEQAFFQHAEHYTRMLGEAQKEMAERQQFHQNRQDGDESRDGQQNSSNGGHQSRDQGGRDESSRDGGGRDHNRRDNGGRDNNGRDNGHRDQQRDQGHRDQAHRDQGHRDQPRSEPAEAQDHRQTPPRQADPAPDSAVEALPDAVTTSEDEPAGPVETPENVVKPARTRTARAPRGDKPATPRTPRGRRKAPEGEAAPDETPAPSEE